MLPIGARPFKVGEEVRGWPTRRWAAVGEVTSSHDTHHVASR
jgi:hypothetical protein